MSHAWQDGHERKVQMLRSFLCRDALLARITVPSLLLAVFLLPLGTGIYAWLPWFPWWAPSLLPLAVLALVYLWVALSSAGAVPRAWRPWAMSPRTIWLGTPLWPTPLSLSAKLPCELASLRVGAATQTSAASTNRRPR